MSNGSKNSGMVYLVGAGPGDPGLLTIKGAACLGRADVVIYDYLANPELLKYAPAGAERIYVGKRTSHHTVDQEGINSLIVEKARQGKTVVRLKGGDPFVFGRGGEEARELVEAGIAFEIVPGITSGVAAPLYAGIPLTMRGLNATVAFATGHETDEKEFSMLDWAALAKMGTLVFYMGVKNLSRIAAHLVAAGRPAETPCAIIRWGSYPRQEVFTGTLADIAAVAERNKVKQPAIIVIGEVVAMRDTLRWFEKKPLFGRRVVVTRTREQAGMLSERLAELGAEVVELPTIEIVPPESWAPLDAALDDIGGYDTVIFTSVNGVTAFFERLRMLKKDVRILAGRLVCAIGPATAKALDERGIIVEIMPEKYVAESVMDALKTRGIAGKRFLLARALLARDVIPDEIRAAGGEIDVVPVYRTVSPAGVAERLAALLAEGRVDAVTFTSSSTVSNFFAVVPAASFPRSVACCSIGPVTSRTLRAFGLEPAVEADVFTIDGLVGAMVRQLSAVSAS